MKKTKYRRLAAMASSLLCCLIFTVPAYAQSSEPQPETTPAPAETEAEPETQNPFTPDGTGTVVDNATDEDGKEFSKARARRSLKRCIVSSGWSFPADRKASAWCLVSFTRCIPGIST